MVYSSSDGQLIIVVNQKASENVRILLLGCKLIQNQMNQTHIFTPYFL
jgi:hypothetical protein